jgi:TolA-binding protein
MHRTLIGASLLVLLTTGLAAADTKAPAKHAKPAPIKVAPADEYFGHLKMSILGIRNTIKDEGLKIDADVAQGANVVKSFAFTEDALHDWEKKYPQDTWIPHTLFVLERVYAKVDSDEARAKAVATMKWLVHDYPKAPDAVVGRTELAQNKVGVKPVVVPAADVTATGGAATTASAPASSPAP